MANYQLLKADIDEKVYQNGHQEITGINLNSVLNQMVTTLGEGYQFAGVATTATNPGTPDAKVFYIANGKGTYTNFGGIEVTEDEVVVLYWDSSWHKVSTGIASNEKLTELGQKIDYFSINDTLRNERIVADYARLGAMYSATDGAFSITNYRKLTDILMVVPGEQFQIVNCDNYESTLSVVALDEDFNVILADSIAGNLSDYTYTIGETTKYIRFGCYANMNIYRIITDAEKNINNGKLAYDSTPTKDGTKLLQSGKIFDLRKAIQSGYVKIASDNLLGLSLLESGYINSSGGEENNSTYQRTGLIPVKENTTYYLRGVQLGSPTTYNAFYDENLQFISAFAGNYETWKSFTSPANAAFIRMSFGATTATENIYLGTSETSSAKYNPIEEYFSDLIQPYINNSINLQRRNFGFDISDLSKWNKTYLNIWTIDASGKSAVNSANGYDNRLFYQPLANGCEDDFDMSIDITPLTGDNDGYFEVAFGKFMGVSGTILSIGKDAGGNYYAVYNINENTIPVLYDKHYFTDVLDFGLQKKISVILKKRTDTDGYFDVSIIDAKGNIVESTNLHPATYAWGAPAIYVNVGTAKVENVQFGYPLNLNDIKVVIWGHSFVEGNSIAGNKNSRWCAKLRNDIGQKNVAVLGLGGSRIIDLELHYETECDALNGARYAILMYGTNDEDTSATTGKMGVINDYLLSKNIIPFWTTVAPRYPDGQTKPTIESFIESNLNYIDIRPAFYDMSGNLDETMFMADHIHPSIACHEKIYQIVKGQLHNLYTI